MSKFSDIPFHVLNEYLSNKNENTRQTGRLLSMKTNIVASNSSDVDVYLKTNDGFFKLNLTYDSVDRLYHDYDLFKFKLNDNIFVKTGYEVNSEGNILYSTHSYFYIKNIDFDKLYVYDFKNHYSGGYVKCSNIFPLDIHYLIEIDNYTLYYYTDSYIATFLIVEPHWDDETISILNNPYHEKEVKNSYVKHNNKFIKYNDISDYTEYDGDEIYYVITMSDITISDILEKDYHGCEIYFRKDSPFFDFVKNYNKYYPNEYNSGNINTNQDYIYIGKLDSIDGDKINIKYHGYKDYALMSLPPVNRTDYLKTFLDTYFDKLYMSDYNLLKNILKMSDPYEVDQKYLNYIALTYDFNIPVIISENKQRDFVAALPELLKKKGTYDSLYIMWRMLTNTKNGINIFDRWNTWDDKHFFERPIDNFIDFIYTYNIPQKYNIDAAKGYTWNNNYNRDYILNIHDYKNIFEFENDENVWVIEHKLFHYPFVSFYDNNGNLIQPQIVQYVDENTIFATFDEGIKGRAVVLPFKNLKNSIIHEQNDPTNEWIIDFDILKQPLINVIAEEGFVMYPTNISKDENNNIILQFDVPVSGKAYIGEPNDSYTISQYTRGEGNIIYHNLGTNRIMVSPIILHEDDVIKIESVTVIGNLIIIVKTNTIYSPITFKVYTSYDNTLPIIYEESGYFLSPHFIFEMNLSREPFGKNYIINKFLLDEIIKNIEYIKPVSRFSHYRELISPVTNFSKKEISLYDNRSSDAYMMSKYIGLRKKDIKKPNNFYDIYFEDSIWSFKYDGGDEYKGVIIQCYDNTYNVIMPNKISFEKTNNPSKDYEYQVDIDWDGHVVNGYCVTITPNYIEDFDDTDNVTIIYDGERSTIPLVQIYDDNNEQIIPKNIEIDLFNHTINIDFHENKTGVVFIYLDNVYYFVSDDFTNSDTWLVEHNIYNTDNFYEEDMPSLDKQFVIVQCFDMNGNVIYPLLIRKIGNNTVEIKFNKNMSGRVTVYSNYDYYYNVFNYTQKKSDNILIQHNTGDMYPHVQCYSNDIDITPNNIHYIDENTLEVKIGKNAKDIKILVLPHSVLDNSYYELSFENKSNIKVNHNLKLGIKQRHGYWNEWGYMYLYIPQTYHVIYYGNRFATPDEWEFPIVTIVDEDNNVIMPNNVKFIDGDNLEVDMDIETSGKIIIGMTALYELDALNQGGYDYIDLIWGLYKNVYSIKLVDGWDSDNLDLIVPGKIEYFGNEYDEHYEITGKKSNNYFYYVPKYAYKKETHIHYQYEPSHFWIIKHDFENYYHLIQCFDFDGVLIPSEVYSNYNTSYVRFFDNNGDDAYKTGYALCYSNIRMSAPVEIPVIPVILALKVNQVGE